MSQNQHTARKTIIDHLLSPTSYMETGASESYVHLNPWQLSELCNSICELKKQVEEEEQKDSLNEEGIKQEYMEEIQKVKKGITNSINSQRQSRALIEELENEHQKYVEEFQKQETNHTTAPKTRVGKMKEELTSYKNYVCSFTVTKPRVLSTEISKQA